MASTRGSRRRGERAAVAVVAVVGLGLLTTTAVQAAAVERLDRAAAVPVPHPVVSAVAPPPAGLRDPSPYTAMWLWDNPVHVTNDARGRNFNDADPPTVAAFAREHGVRTVYLAAPWNSDEGPIARWFDAMVVVLRREGVEVAPLGGDETWLTDPSLGAHWVQDAVRGRGVGRVQLDLEPWALPLWQTDQDRAVAQWLAAVDAVRAALPAGVELGVDAPYWLATTPDGAGGTLFDDVLARADTVAVVTFQDTAEGDAGILTLSADARRAAEAAGVPYTVGIETDSPLVAGGPAHTFFDDGVLALDTQAGIVDRALRGDEHYRGISVERYRTWRHLVDVAAGTLVR